MTGRHQCLIGACGLAIVLFVCCMGEALAADSTPSPTASAMPPPPTRDQDIQLLNAIAYESTPNSGKVVIDVIDAGKMPAYDPLSHYLGMPDGKTPTIQVAANPKATKAEIENALGRAMSLAVMDDGEAGSYWKDSVRQSRGEGCHAAVIGA